MSASEHFSLHCKAHGLFVDRDKAFRGLLSRPLRTICFHFTVASGLFFSCPNVFMAMYDTTLTLTPTINTDTGLSEIQGSTNKRVNILSFSPQPVPSLYTYSSSVGCQISRVSERQ